eukprot:scaffold2771_cov252-Pinguiococcus_pyrenoidosus.AAC.50
MGLRRTPVVLMTSLANSAALTSSWSLARGSASLDIVMVRCLDAARNAASRTSSAAAFTLENTCAAFWRMSRAGARVDSLEAAEGRVVLAQDEVREGDEVQDAVHVHGGHAGVQVGLVVKRPVLGVSDLHPRRQACHLLAGQVEAVVLHEPRQLQIGEEPIARRVVAVEDVPQDGLGLRHRGASQGRDLLLEHRRHTVDFLVGETQEGHEICLDDRNFSSPQLAGVGVVRRAAGGIADDDGDGGHLGPGQVDADVLQHLAQLGQLQRLSVLAAVLEERLEVQADGPRVQRLACALLLPGRVFVGLGDVRAKRHANRGRLGDGLCLRKKARLRVCVEGVQSGLEGPGRRRPPELAEVGSHFVLDLHGPEEHVSAVRHAVGETAVHAAEALARRQEDGRRQILGLAGGEGQLHDAAALLLGKRHGSAAPEEHAAAQDAQRASFLAAVGVHVGGEADVARGHEVRRATVGEEEQVDEGAVALRGAAAGGVRSLPPQRPQEDGLPLGVHDELGAANGGGLLPQQRRSHEQAAAPKEVDVHAFVAAAGEADFVARREAELDVHDQLLLQHLVRMQAILVGDRRVAVVQEVVAVRAEEGHEVVHADRLGVVGLPAVLLPRHRGLQEVQDGRQLVGGQLQLQVLLEDLRTAAPGHGRFAHLGHLLEGAHVLLALLLHHLEHPVPGRGRGDAELVVAEQQVIQQHGHVHRPVLAGPGQELEELPGVGLGHERLRVGMERLEGTAEAAQAQHALVAERRASHIGAGHAVLIQAGADPMHHVRQGGFLARRPAPDRQAQLVEHAPRWPGLNAVLHVRYLSKRPSPSSLVISPLKDSGAPR